MIRRLFIVAVSLAALTACTTYDSGYRNYSPAQAGYGDYYYAPDPGPSYYSPGYAAYPAYYSLYWGFDRQYYSSWRRPHFSYGVTWFPNDWFGFSAVHRYPRYDYWHPYAPYRYSAWDHRFAWHHYAQPPRHRYRPSPPRYGHPSNERHMQREQLVGGGGWGGAPNASGPRGRSALEAVAPQRSGNAPQRSAYRDATARPASSRGVQASDARMRQQAFEVREARLRDQAARARPVGEPANAARQGAQRPWQQAQPAPRARAGLTPDNPPTRSIPDRRESQGPRQLMGDPRRAPMREAMDARRQAPRIGDAPRARPTAPVAAPQQRRMPVQQAPQDRQARPQARQQMRQMPNPPQPRMTRPAAPRAAPAPSPMRQAPMRQAMPAPAAPAPAPMRQMAPPVRQAAPPMRQAAPAERPTSPRRSGRARNSLEREP